jgi:hypothetical protein
MRSLQDYRNIYAEIARNNGITGDSVELLVQLLANASYISEVENISYVQEASLEKATLVNSKIQHCMNQMYSVFRGRCPRVILKFKPTKYMEFNVYDPIVRSNDFSVYYLGYLSDTGENVKGTKSLPIEEGFVYAPCKINPALEDETYTIIGLIAKERVDKDWTTSKFNTYYVETLEENLSSDMYVKVDGEYVDTTRVFSNHILDHYIYDLTTTSWSSRLYIYGLFGNTVERDDEPVEGEIKNDANINLSASYYRFSRISDYKPAELKKINISGSEMTGFKLDENSLYRGYSETAPGVIIIPEIDREGIDTIHYKANRDRFVSSIVRSNSDVGAVLEEMFPTKVMPYGTNYIFQSGNSGSRVDLYYVPIDPLILLTDSEIDEFIETKKAYYIVDDIFVNAGKQYTAFMNIDLELYKPFTIDSEISKILKTYEKKFGTDLRASLDEIKTLISKVSNVKQVRDINITYLDPGENTILPEDVDSNLYDGTEIKPDIYFKIEYSINSIVQTRS